MRKISLKKNEEISITKLLSNTNIFFDPYGEYLINLKVEEGFLYFVERFENGKLKSFVIVTKELNTTIQHNAYYLRTFYNNCIAHFSINKIQDDLMYEKINLYQSSLN